MGLIARSISDVRRYWVGMYPANGYAAASTTNLTADRMYYNLVYFGQGFTIDRIGCYVTVTAGTQIRMGIYNAVEGSNDWLPDTLLLDGGQVAAGNGLKTVTVNQVLQNKPYFLAIVCDGAATVVGTVGWNTINNGLNPSSFGINFGYYLAAAGIGAMASPAVVTGASSNNAPLVAVRISAL